MNRFRLAAPSLAGVLPVALALALVAPPADALVFLSTNGGSACKPAYGASTKFNFTELYALNTGTTDQYLVCGFANFSIGAVSTPAQPINTLLVYFQSGATGGTAVCTAKMGSWETNLDIASVSTKSITLAPNTTDYIEFHAVDLPRDWEHQALSMNCKLPGGFKLGSIKRWEPEPASGTGWTP